MQDFKTYRTLQELADDNGFSRQYAHSILKKGKVEKITTQYPVDVYIFDKSRSRKVKVKRVYVTDPPTPSLSSQQG